jgi:hypothetical protein
MLVLHQLLYILFIIHGVFMHFPELTYQQDAIVPVPVFCCFCVSEKLHRKYSRNWTKRKPKFLFTWHEDGVQRRDREQPGGGFTMGWHGPPPGRATRWCGSLVHPLILPEHFSMKHTTSRRCHWPGIGRVQKLFPAPCWRGESSPEAFFITMPASEVMRE